MLHAQFRTGGLSAEDSPTDLRWLLDACAEEVSRSVLDLELQADALHLLDETREAVDRAEEVLDSRWAIMQLPDGAPALTLIASAHGRTSVQGSFDRFAKLTDDCATCAFRLSALGFLVPDGTEFWPQEMQDRNRNFVRGPVYRHGDGGFSLEEPRATPA